MKAVYIFGGFVAVVIGAGFVSWIGFILINGMRKRIARINKDRRDRSSLRRY